MIKKENFINLIKSLENQKEFDFQATYYMEKIFTGNYIGLYDNKLYSDVIEFLIEEMNDGINGWIEYFIYELDYGSKWTIHSVLDKDNNSIDISTSDKLYDFLVKN